MELKIKDLYGIRDEVTFDSGNKKNIVIFAPNGIGKSSIYRGFKDIKNNEEYSGMEDTPPFFNFKSNGIKFNYKTGNKENGENVLLINHEFKSISKEGIINALATSGSLNIKNLNEPIFNFNEKIFKKINEEERQILNFYEWNNNVQITMNNYSDYLHENNNKSIDEIKQQLFNYNNTLKILNSIIESKVHTFNSVGDYALLNQEAGELESTTKDILLNIKIINDIKEQKSGTEDDFGFKKKDSNSYIGISEISDEYIEYYNNKYTKKEIELIVALRKIEEIIPKKTDGNFSRSSKFKSFIKILRGEIKTLVEEKFICILKENKNEFLKIEKKYKKESNDLLVIANKKIEKINSFLNKDSLDWKMEIRKMEALYKPIQINTKNDKHNDIKTQDFEEYASEGQKNILSLISQIITLYEKKGTIVMDDVMSSFDNQHADELFFILNDDGFKKVNLLILTHNFEWLRSIAFTPLGKSSEFVFFDKIAEGKYKTVIGDQSNIKNTMNTKNIIKNSNINNIEKFITISSLIREVLANILISSEFPIKGAGSRNVNNYKNKVKNLDKNRKKILSAIEFFDQYARHYKGNITTENLFKKYNKKISSRLSNNLPILKEIKKLIKKIKNEENVVFGNLVRDLPVKWDRIDSFEEYVSLKIFFGMQTRFETEYKQYYESKNIVAQKLWENEEKWGKAWKKLTKKYKEMENYKSNYLAHVNNMQWNKIIEFPIYKLEKMNE